MEGEARVILANVTAGATLDWMENNTMPDPLFGHFEFLTHFFSNHVQMLFTLHQLFFNENRIVRQKMRIGCLSHLLTSEFDCVRRVPSKSGPESGVKLDVGRRPHSVGPSLGLPL
jgi:hypothetical protein